MGNYFDVIDKVIIVDPLILVSNVSSETEVFLQSRQIRPSTQATKVMNTSSASCALIGIRMAGDTRGYAIHARSPPSLARSSSGGRSGRN